MVVVIRPFIFGEHMTVPASDRLSQLYTGNGVNTRFDFTFRVFDQEDATGIAVKVDLGTEFETMDESLYQVTINQDNLGGYVVFNTAPSNQTSFYIAGETPVDQALDITNYDNFYPDSIEKSLDKLTAILQEWSHLLGFEEQARKLSNIKYDESAQLRENQIKAELQDSINFIEQNTSAKLQEAIANGTVSALAITTVENESDLAELIKWDGRTVAVANVGNFKFNSNNNRWERDFITDRQVVTVSSIDELLTLPKWNGRTVYVKSYIAGMTLGGGDFTCIKNGAETDGGYNFKVGQYTWQRCKSKPFLDVTDFGLIDGGQLDTPLDNAIKYALANGVQSVYIPTTGKNDYQFNGGLSYELRNSPIMISMGSMGRSGQRIQHNGANIGVTFKSFADLWSPAVLLNLSVNGTPNGIAFARFSDSWQNHFDHSFVTGYENGSIAEIYNEANWTENFCSTNVTSRDCKFGFYFHRNPDENPSSVYPDKHPTESFYRTKISNFNFQHGIAGASVGIVVGDPTNTSNAYSHCNMYSSEIDIGGWFEGGGNSSAIFISEGSVIHLSDLKFMHDGIFSLASPNPPYRLVNLGGPNAKLSNSRVIRQDTQVGIIDISNILVRNGTTDLFPFRSVCFKASEFASQDGVDNFDATVSPIKFKFSLNAGEFATISLQRFFKASEYRIKVTQNDAISNVYRYHSQGLTNVGFLVCETLHPKVTTTLNTAVTPNTASSYASLPDSGTAAGVVVKLLGNQPQGAYDINNFLGCEVYVPTVASDSTFTVMIEKIS